MDISKGCLIEMTAMMIRERVLMLEYRLNVCIPYNRFSISQEFFLKNISSFFCFFSLLLRYDCNNCSFWTFGRFFVHFSQVLRDDTWLKAKYTYLCWLKYSHLKTNRKYWYKWDLGPRNPRWGWIYRHPRWVVYLLQLEVINGVM